MRQSLIKIIKEDYAWWKNQPEGKMRRESRAEWTEEDFFIYYLEAVMNDEPYVSRGIRQEIVECVAEKIDYTDL